MGKGCWDLQNDIVAKTRELTHRWQAIKLFGYMVVVAQLVRASDCGSEGRGFEPRLPPFNKNLLSARLALERHAVVVYVFEIDTKARLQSGKLSCEDVGAAVNVLCLGYEPNLFIWVNIVLNQDSFKGLKR